MLCREVLGASGQPEAAFAVLEYAGATTSPAAFLQLLLSWGVQGGLSEWFAKDLQPGEGDNAGVFAHNDGLGYPSTEEVFPGFSEIRLQYFILFYFIGFHGKRGFKNTACCVMLCDAFAKMQRLCHDWELSPHPWPSAGRRQLPERGGSSSGEEKNKPTRDFRDQGGNLLGKFSKLLWDSLKERLFPMCIIFCCNINQLHYIPAALNFIWLRWSQPLVQELLDMTKKLSLLSYAVRND